MTTTQADVATMTLAQAITAGLGEALERHPEMLLFGEDVGANGGVFRITDGLQAQFGQDRVFDSPLAESGILGTAIGLANEGFRPVPEIQFGGFVLQAMDAIVAQFSRWRYRYGGTQNMPITVRIPFGGGVHTPELHSDNIEHLLATIPGLRVVCPTTAYDAKGLIGAAIDSNDPVIFLEHLKLYRSVKDEVPLKHYTVDLDTARIARPGTDISLIAYGAMVVEALHAADTLAQQGVNAEVIDLRSLAPLDVDTLVASVTATHRAVVIQEAQRIAGVGAQVVAELQQRAFMQLDAPIARVAAPDTPHAFAAAEHDWLPSAADIVAAARTTLDY